MLIQIHDKGIAYDIVCEDVFVRIMPSGPHPEHLVPGDCVYAKTGVDLNDAIRFIAANCSSWEPTDVIEVFHTGIAS